MPAILFGSISAIADTSELQRRSFNDAFATHELDWEWDRDTYRDLLTSNGGAQRIADWAQQQGDDVDADAVHATKSRRFQELLREEGVAARGGVLETVRAARDRHVPVALVTTTSAANVDALREAVGLGDDDLALVLTRDDVEQGKPDPQVYELALDRLDVDAATAVAIEDNVGGVAAATDAGIACIATPNANTADHDFGRATEVMDTLDPERVLARMDQGATSS